ncbi:MAG TPA: FecR family protein [Chlamydiales bacterium]
MKMWLWIFLLCSSLSAAFAQDVAKVAKLIAVQGDVKAFGGGQKERFLSRGSDIFLHDTLVVAEGSTAQLKFTDGGLMTLIASTQFSIDSYHFNTPGQKDESVSSLAKGGFRAVSGSISKSNPDNYEVKTPSATIGLRGTTFDIHVLGQEVYCGCTKGMIEVVNSAGRIRIGKSAPVQFAYIPSPNDKPIALPERPPELSPQTFSPPPGGHSLQGERVLGAEGPGPGSISPPALESTSTPNQPQVIISDQRNGCE